MFYKCVYVVGALADGSESWVLTPDENHTIASAQRAINWQGNSHPTVWHICRFDSAAKHFVSVGNGRCFQPRQGPYTDEAWARFQANFLRACGVEE